MALMKLRQNHCQKEEQEICGWVGDKQNCQELHQGTISERIKAICTEGPCLGCRCFFPIFIRMRSISHCLGPRKWEWHRGGSENKGGNLKRKARLSVEDKDNAGNDKSWCLWCGVNWIRNGSKIIRLRWRGRKRQREESKLRGSFLKFMKMFGFLY